MCFSGKCRFYYAHVLVRVANRARYFFSKGCDACDAQVFGSDPRRSVTLCANSFGPEGRRRAAEVPQS